MSTPFGYGAQMDESREEVDLYEVLGVHKGASSAEIKKAYRKAALTSHPDKKPEHEREDASIKFKAISEAHEILSNDQTRSLYDQHGMAAFEKGGGMDGDVDMQDFVSQMFGGAMGGMPGMPGMPGMNGRRRKPARGPNENMNHQATLEELYKGKTTRLKAERKVHCTHCKGSGSKEGAKQKTCDTCQGRGQAPRTVTVGPGMITRVLATCGTCHGEGTFFKEKDRCKKCKGSRVTDQQKSLELFVPAGSRHGDKIRLYGEADQLPDQEPGDLIFTIIQKEHQIFKRVGADLVAEIDITLAEALTGFDRVVLKHLDGRGIQLKNNPLDRMLKPNQFLKVPGEGMPVVRKEYKGDLYLKVNIQFPEDGFFKDPSILEQLRNALPKPAPAIEADEIDEVSFEANVDTSTFGQSNNATGDMNDDDDGQPHPVQCATQ